MSDKNQISIKKYDNYIVVSLNGNVIRPEQIYHDLVSVVDEINTNKNIWAVGFDLRSTKQISNMESAEHLLNYSMTSLILNIKKPVIGLVNGEVSNRLLEFILPMDYRIAGTNSSFKMSQMFQEKMQSDGVTQVLPRIIGLNKSKEMMMFGGTYDSSQAYNLGLINLVVDKTKLESSLFTKLDLLVKQSPLAIQFTKSAINFNSNTNTVRGMDMENDLYSILLSSKDRKKSIDAIKSKNKPNSFSSE